MALVCSLIDRSTRMMPSARSSTGNLRRLAVGLVGSIQLDLAVLHALDRQVVVPADLSSLQIGHWKAFEKQESIP